MSDKVIIAAQKRDVTGKKVAALRAQGIMPAVVYGHGQKPETISLDAVEFGKTYSRVGHSTILELKVDGGATKNVLIQDVQQTLHSTAPQHADFYMVKMDEVVRTSVPLHFTGESTAVFQEGGSLLTSLQEVEIECLPAKLPANIEVDISVLDDFEKTITVADLKVPADVKVMAEPEELVARVEEPRSQEEVDEDLNAEIGEAAPAEEGEEAPAEEGDKPAEDKDAS